MQPVSLHRLLISTGLDDPNISGRRLWRRRHTLDPVYRDYLRRLAFLLLVAPLVCNCLAMLVVAALEQQVDLTRLARGVAVGVAGGVAFGMAVGVTTILTVFRLPLYPFEALLQGYLYLSSRPSPQRTLAKVPVLFHDLSYLPHPFLARHIVAAADQAPELAARVMQACRIAPGQRRAGRSALAELQARELKEMALDGRFDKALNLEGRWLPGLDTDSSLLRGLAEAARFIAAAQGSTSPYLARQHLEAAGKQMQAIDNLLLGAREPLARFFPETLAAWQGVLRRMSAQAERAAAIELPNPFVTGNPLSAELRWGQALFRGREETIRQVEGLLAGQHGDAAIALIGPRRCGKSSLLNMLRSMLPDTQVVLFDLQDNPAASPEALYRALARRAREQAYQDRRLSLPEFPNGLPIEALQAWLDALEVFPGVARFLICIDEFEGLETLFPGERADLDSSDGRSGVRATGQAQRRDLLQFMGLMRATIQHRRRVRLLVAGAAPFDELDHLWNDHFVNLRELRLGYLDETTSVALLRKPVPEFPIDAIPEAVAQAVCARTGGQPFLTQLFGSLLVDRLNDQRRKAAAAEDLGWVEEQALDQASYYFHDLWSDVPESGRNCLRALVAGQPWPADAATRRWLRRRLLVGQQGELLVPVFGRWLTENVTERE